MFSISKELCLPYLEEEKKNKKQFLPLWKRVKSSEKKHSYSLSFPLRFFYFSSFQKKRRKKKVFECWDLFSFSFLRFSHDYNFVPFTWRRKSSSLLSARKRSEYPYSGVYHNLHNSIIIRRKRDILSLITYEARRKAGFKGQFSEGSSDKSTSEKESSFPQLVNHWSLWNKNPRNRELLINCKVKNPVSFISLQTWSDFLVVPFFCVIFD